MSLYDKVVSWVRKNIHRDVRREFLWKNSPRIMLILSKILYLSCFNRFYENEYAKNNNFIACLWHGSFLMMPYFYKKVRGKPNMSFITSAHADGIVVEGYFKLFGLKSIRGSTGTHKGGTRALMQAIKDLKNGLDVAVTPDGPKGPYKSIADGILFMAMKSGIGICGCSIKPSRYWELKTWDKFCIPKPFSTVKYRIKEPLFLDSNLDIEEAREKLRIYMKELDEL